MRDGTSIAVDGNLHSALQRLKRQTEPILAELRRRAYYLPPGEARRLKARKARKRARRDASARAADGDKHFGC